MVESVRFIVGGQVIQEFTGQYLYNMVRRDFDEAKKELFYKMTGNTPEMNDPESVDSNGGYYPSAFYGGGSDVNDSHFIYMKMLVASQVSALDLSISHLIFGLQWQQRWRFR